MFLASLETQQWLTKNTVWIVLKMDLLLFSAPMKCFQIYLFIKFKTVERTLHIYWKPYFASQIYGNGLMARLNEGLI